MLRKFQLLTPLDFNMKLNRKNKTSNEISTSSLPDIIFMLLIFFMVTTVMREFEGLDIVLPRAETIEKLENAKKMLGNTQTTRESSKKLEQTREYSKKKHKKYSKKLEYNIPKACALKH